MTADKYNIQQTLKELGIRDVNPGATTGTQWFDTRGNIIESYSPADGQLIAKVKQGTWGDYEKIIQRAQEAFITWRMIPTPKRGEIVRQIRNELRKYKEPLGKLVSYEMGKIYQEGLGEVQEMIDIADFAVGQSRQLYGSTMHSEREKHRMYDQYHPLGITGIITAFNFPTAVWSWNALIALIAGNVVLWKPSSKVMLCAIAVHNIIQKVLKENNVPEGTVNLIASSSKYIGDDFLADKRVPLISVTGSTRIGKRVARIVGERLGKTILELGGNNAIVISQYGDREMALRASMFGAIATAGQRCTSTRRLIIHECMYDLFKEKLIKAYEQIRVGHPLDEKTVVGPLIDKSAVEDFKNAQKSIKEQDGNIIYGGKVYEGEGFESGCYVQPCIAEVEGNLPIVQEETFAPILYLMKYKNIEEAIQLHNDVPQGLSSAIFSKNIHETERFLSHEGSDCGIANVNIATNGAEIGGAFGGEKETGGGRESGSDAWKAYMRRQTNTINFGTELPLAQGIKFDVFEE
ncbi:MAG: aldehyde dehydrogenase family protein [Bacteroidales bacterium]|nr:aldehyde dehydrogenase family protein [Bacteroidales bacterium]MCF8345253.1 aldehyde dehydrogenase family protein [Bacteroidales bacterium]MCF8352251.1 aldehyde dehydrogenase family protein [Bacteroidales bacterium]MCF8376105.1 aldehyde dehydrogenase family protein [Bacteroidales bacterium]MCF8401418.1 aldehyde dehydrogenase family protein [Bacteroidales bacterium]